MGGLEEKLAPTYVGGYESGSKLRALHTLREGRRGRGEVRLAVWVGWRRS
ncbi:hypothetical protein SBV1_810028 [Verrucomicrobia bacterium]|nr:hypothetical protein SBV1_810028 [Verrucomicrobiota bacterium]